jgi:hypothetical protein
MIMGKAKSLPYSAAPKQVIHVGRLQPNLQTLDFSGNAFRDKNTQTYHEHS